MASLKEALDFMGDLVDYDCIILIIGHTNYDTDEPDYKNISDLKHFKEGCSVTTIIPANVGITCYADNVYVQREVTTLLQEEHYFGLSPQEILDQINGILKPTEDHPDHPKMGYVHPNPTEYCRFLECSGAISTNPDRYYNKLWFFDDEQDDDMAEEDPDQYGCVLIFAERSDGHVVVDSLFSENIKGGTFYLTKEDLLNILFEQTSFKKPLFLDLGCSITNGSEDSIRRFEHEGVFGGKKRKYRK